MMHPDEEARQTAEQNVEQEEHAGPGLGRGPAGARPASRAALPTCQINSDLYQCDNCGHLIRAERIPTRRTVKGRRFAAPGDCSEDEHMQYCPTCGATECFDVAPSGIAALLERCMAGATYRSNAK